LTALALPAAGLAEEHARQKLAVLPFEINDTSGEVGGSGNDEMLKRLTEVFDERIAKSGLYDVVARARVADAVGAVNSGTYLRACNGCEIDIARRAGADRVLIGWIWKVSTLIGTLHIEIKDVATGRTVYAKVFDFRGDNDEAWQRAAGYVVKTMEQRAAQSLGQ
jgi:hypothetical protein